MSVRNIIMRHTYYVWYACSIYHIDYIYMLATLPIDVILLMKFDIMSTEMCKENKERIVGSLIKFVIYFRTMNGRLGHVQKAMTKAAADRK